MMKFTLGRMGLLLALCAIGLAAAAYSSPALRLRFHQSAVEDLHAGVQVDASHFDSAWFDAARLGRVDILQALHEAHYPIDRQTSAGYTAVTLAAYDEQPEALGYLLNAGAAPCVADHNGNTALMGAIYKGNLDVAERLMRAGCPPDQANNAGETALAFAVLFGRASLLDELILDGSDPRHADAKGRTAFDIAVDQGNGDALHALRAAFARFRPACPNLSQSAGATAGALRQGAGLASPDGAPSGETGQQLPVPTSPHDSQRSRQEQQKTQRSCDPLPVRQSS